VIALLAGDAYAPREPEIEPLRMLTADEVARLESGATIVELVQPMPREPLDMAQLESMCMGIPALRDTLLNTFLTEIRPRLERMIEAHAARDARRIEFEAHSLKGMAATIGATVCAEIFSELEDLAREERLAGLAPHFKHAVLEVYRAEKFIASLDRDALAA
jgi:HPt (histidine-containing phosphotransfer) domain-containing protein